MQIELELKWKKIIKRLIEFQYLFTDIKLGVREHSQLQ